MGDTTHILPETVTKIILAYQLVSWVYTDQKLNVGYEYIGFVLNF